MSFVRPIAWFLLVVSPLTAQEFSPEAALAKMKLPDGFSAHLVAAEPLVRQPLAVSFDDRGRLWVLQGLQFPDPAGLKALGRDESLRTTWDRVPAPPPAGPKGADRITILSDPDGDGRYRQAKDFVRGLNLASGFCLGYGGAFVLQSPYLLFYPDRDGDDVPDGDPEVLLTGFGTEDAHSLAGSLKWGPDGWLYGVQGNNVGAKIRGIGFRQGIWRYRPRTREFEVFSEGGGDTHGLDFDRYGQALAGTDRYGHAMVHQMQGARYGDGGFGHVPCEGFRGGRVARGGIVYRGDSWPAEYRDRYIAANPISNAIVRYRLDAKGASYVSSHVGEVLTANDPRFRPLECLLGPEGSVYVADWYDRRTARLDSIDTWDRTNGRIYRIDFAGTKPAKVGRIERTTATELADRLAHPSAWWRDAARRELAQRRDPKIVPLLRDRVSKTTGVAALENLWGLYASGGFDRATALVLLRHPESWVRAWTIRLLGDDRTIDPAIRDELVRIASDEAAIVVRAQLACSLRRFAAADAVPAILAMIRRDADADDPHLPLLVWWAVETHFTPRTIPPEGVRRSRLWREAVAERLARKWFGPDAPLGYTGLAELLRTADALERAALIRGIDIALDGRAAVPPEEIPGSLREPIAEGWRREPESPVWNRVALRTGVAEATARIRTALVDPRTPEADLLRSIALAAELPDADITAALNARLDSPGGAVRRAVAGVLMGHLADAGVRRSLVGAVARQLPAERAGSIRALLAHPDAAMDVLRLVESKAIAPGELPPGWVRTLSLHRRPALDTLTTKLYGKPTEATVGVKLARISWLGVVLSRGPGDAVRGGEVFGKLCASCHRLHGRGVALGPNLAGVDRRNRGYLLANIIDPSGDIRPEFVTRNVRTIDGRRFSGTIVETRGETVTLVRADGGEIERVSLRRGRIAEIARSSVSPMPEKLLDDLREAELRDLFAFLADDS